MRESVISDAVVHIRWLFWTHWLSYLLYYLLNFLFRYSYRAVSSCNHGEGCEELTKAVTTVIGEVFDSCNECKWHGSACHFSQIWRRKQIQFYITGFITKPLLKVVNILLKNK